jgi:CBS-domain-containing membrane protein
MGASAVLVFIPVVGETGKLLGMVTQSDVMAALKVGEAGAAAVE